MANHRRPRQGHQTVSAFETVMADSKRLNRRLKTMTARRPKVPLTDRPCTKKSAAKMRRPAKQALKKIAHIFVPIIPCLYRLRPDYGPAQHRRKVDPTLAAQPVFQMLAIAGNAAFFGLNIFVGINAAKEFGGSPMLGASWPPS